jgi:hypothetical protein
MGRRWTDQDISELKLLAPHHPPHRIAELIDRTVGGVVFKAHTLKVSLRYQNAISDQSNGADRLVGAIGP